MTIKNLEYLHPFNAIITDENEVIFNLHFDKTLPHGSKQIIAKLVNCQCLFDDMIQHIAMSFLQACCLALQLKKLSTRTLNKQNVQCPHKNQFVFTFPKTFN